MIYTGDLLLIYGYIKYCLWQNWGAMSTKDKRLATIKDMQHDIFLYMIDKKGIKEFNAGSRRLAFLLAKYYPGFLGRHKYSRISEHVLLDLEGNVIEPGVSYFVGGDIQYDLDLLNKPRPLSATSGTTAQPILVHYINGEQILFDSIKQFCEKECVNHTTVYRWVHYGMPVRFGRKKEFTKIMKHNPDGMRENDFSRGEYKYRHIKKVEYMHANPFTGSTTVVKRKIIESSWDKRKDHDDFEEEDANEYCRLLIHKESGEAWLVTMSNPKGSEHYIKKMVDEERKSSIKIFPSSHTEN